MKKAFFAVLVLFVSSLGFANWEQDFEQIKDIPRNYQDAGAICEEIGRLQAQRKFDPAKYEVLVGIAYGDLDRAIGELDLVVFDRATSKVKTIAEVKCWKNMSGGLRKAHEQRSRFLSTIKSGKTLFFRSTSTDEEFEQEQFQHISSFTTMGQKGAVKAGYDDELEYDLRQLHEYSDVMIACQNRGECAQP